jgi:serine/threonine protein kinase
MAILIDSPTGSGPNGNFERELVDELRRVLPESFKILPNFSVKQTGHAALEYDVVVLAPHAVFVLEAKEWYGRLTGDDTEWLINSTPKKCPMWLVDVKCKVLKTKVGPLSPEIRYEPLLIVPDDRIQILLGGSWANHVQTIRGAVRVMQDPSWVPRATPILPLHRAILQQLQGNWAARRRDRPRRIAGFEVIETISVQEGEAEYLARRVLIHDPGLYRIRTWPLSPYLDPTEKQQREEVIRRPAEALAAIGRHPNLLQILAFDRLDEEREFYEITEWSDHGSLYGFLKNEERDQLTLRERLEIALGVACALEAVHARGLVHRNVCPETILIDAEGNPRLTDFDRAYLARGQTIFAATQNRAKNPAYIPPELEDVTDYKFDSSSDMYSFGVLLYELLTDDIPFASPAIARDAHGKPPRRPSQVRDGVDLRLDDLVLQLLEINDFHRRPPAADVVSLLNAVLGTKEDEIGQRESTVSQIFGARATLDIGTILDGVYRIDAELGKGAFSQVLKVYHLLQGRAFAMKLLTRDDEGQLMLDEFNRIGRHLPEHPNIAQMIWMDRLAPPVSTMYILSEYVEGETLAAYCKGDKKLPWTDIRNIAHQLLDVLEAIHPKTKQLATLSAKLQEGTITPEEYLEYQRLRQQVNEGILHRDIKPANILLELPSHRPKLIDFNIATRLVDATGQGGTPRYWAPDRGQPDWRPDMDLFSLGVVVYELVTHSHPFQNDNPSEGIPLDPRDVRPDLRLGDELARFLLKAVQPHGVDRFEDAATMRDALLSVSSFHAPEPVPITHGTNDLYPGITLNHGEVGRANYNPYVTRLLTLFSQAQLSNGGTRAGFRGLDEIARLTYVPTRLDEKLTPVIAEGRFRLVIVTGNAGDGKTAYVQTVEQFFQQLGAEIEALPTGNGSRWTHGALNYQTNYDGSQDEEDLENNAVLEQFFSPFSGDTLVGLDGGEVRLIAVNEGRLLDFLDHSEARDRYTGMRRFVKSALEGLDSPAGALLVNLNLRGVTAGGRNSLIEAQLRAILREDLWRPCNVCSIRSKCPIKHNVSSLADDVNGQTVRDRVRRLFEVVYLRRRSHITMRDLRSSLSWLLLRDRSCEDVAALLARDDEQAARELASIYYPDAFAHDVGMPKQTVDDRLVALLREADIGFVNDPQLDHRLDREPETAVPWMTFEGRPEYASRVLLKLARDAPRTVHDAGFGTLLRIRRGIVARWRRHAYYERRDEGWLAMVPYRSLRLLDEIMTSADPSAIRKASDTLRDRIIDSISLSEGMRNQSVRTRYLALRVSRVRNPSLRSYRLFPREAFVVEVNLGGKVTDFLEFVPDSIDLVAVTTYGTARLRISLDLLEMLELIMSGYRPSADDLQGLFVNLMMFRNELLGLPFDRIMVTQDDINLYEISVSTGHDGVIRLHLGEGGVNAIGAKLEAI